MPTYIKREDAKLRMGVTSAAYDGLLDALADAVESQIRLYLGFDPAKQSVTWYLTGAASQVLTLPAPVSAVSAVYEDTEGNYGNTAGSFDSAATLLTLGVDYALRREGNEPFVSALVRLNTFWPYQWARPVGRLANEVGPCRGCVKVVATQGESPVNAVCVQAGLDEVAAQWAMRVNGYGMLQSEAADGLSVSLTPPSFNAGDGRPRFVSPVAEMLLRPYRRVSIGRVM